MYFQQEFHFLKRDFENGGYLGRRFAPTVHPQGMGALLEIESGPKRRRSERHHRPLLAQILELRVQAFDALLQNSDRRVILRLLLAAIPLNAPKQ